MFKYITNLIFVLFLSNLIYAQSEIPTGTPVCNDLKTIVLNNGETIEAFYKGDSRLHWIETKEKYIFSQFNGQYLFGKIVNNEIINTEISVSLQNITKYKSKLEELHLHNETALSVQKNKIKSLKNIGGVPSKGKIKVAVLLIPNWSIIKEIDLSKPEWFMAAKNYKQVAIDHAWYNPKSGKPFIWQEAYSPTLREWLSGRFWLFYSKYTPNFKEWPNRKLSDPFKGQDAYHQYVEDISIYPFLVKPEKNISVQDIMEFQRSTFKGTIYNKTLDPDWYVPRSARWAIDFVDNLLYLRWQDAVEDLFTMREPLQADFFNQIEENDKQAQKLYDKSPKKAKEFLTEKCHENMQKVLDVYNEIRNTLITKYTNNKQGS